MSGHLRPSRPDAHGRAGVRPDVSVVIVAHGGGDLVRRALRALEHDPAPPTREIIVVDSGEPDGPAAWLRHERPDVTLVEPGENLGFGPANNRGIAHSRGRYVLLLNPDAFVDEGCIGELVALPRGAPRGRRRRAAAALR